MPWGKLKWNSPWAHVKSFCLCSETKLKHLCILKYTWKKWMYFFFPPKNSMFHSLVEREKLVRLCISVRKPTDTEHGRLDNDPLPVSRLWVFQESRGLLFPPALCQSHVASTCILNLARHYFKRVSGSRSDYPSSSRWKRMLLIF